MLSTHIEGEEMLSEGSIESTLREIGVIHFEIFKLDIIKISSAIWFLWGTYNIHFVRRGRFHGRE